MSGLSEQSAAPVVEEVELRALNGERLAVRRWSPTALKARAAVLVVPAMATRARFYQPLAEWLAARGLVVYTFDYQGYGDSADTALKQVRADILTWAQDAATVAHWAKQDAGELPMTWLGHSLGCQLLPFTEQADVDAAVLVNGGAGYWRLSRGANRVVAPLLWYAVAPAVTSLFGYYPGRRIKLLGDLPAPVMRQWAQWCRQPEYLFGVLPELRETFAQVHTPMTSISVTDDETMSEAATAQLESFYTGTELRHYRFTPGELGRSRIGHMGLFRRDSEDLWETVLLPHLTPETRPDTAVP